ncbi:MAG: hypothetical protein KatS3mg087_0467 [Patescibacteria group bacterium]|nr:MAG: hypothetical protein KatS3mg087_0467 [Patescibacteria group bacterium]
MKYFVASYYYHRLNKDNRLKKYLGNLTAELRLNEKLMDDNYGTVLFEVDLSKIPYPQPNQDIVLYDSDDLMIMLMNPNDYRIAHPAFCALNIPTPTCNIHFTRYPHPSTGFDESGLKNKEGLWFGMLDPSKGIVSTNYVHKEYEFNPVGKNLAKIYVRIVPVVSESYLRNEPCLLKFKIGSPISQEELENIKTDFNSLILQGVSPEEIEKARKDDSYRVYYIGDELFFYPYDDYFRSGDEFLIVTTDFTDGNYVPIDQFIEDLRAGRSNTSQYEVKSVAVVLDRYFGKLFIPTHVKSKDINRAKSSVYDLSVPDYIFRDPFGDFGGMMTLLTFQFSPVLKLLHFPADIAIESIVAAESEKAYWMNTNVDDSNLPIDVDAERVLDELVDDDGDERVDDEEDILVEEEDELV